MLIKNLIFDLGNVIIDVDDTRTLDALFELGVASSRDIFTVQQQSQICDALLASHSTAGNVSHHDTQLD